MDVDWPDTRALGALFRWESLAPATSSAGNRRCAQHVAPSTAFNPWDRLAASLSQSLDHGASQRKSHLHFQFHFACTGSVHYASIQLECQVCDFGTAAQKQEAYSVEVWYNVPVTFFLLSYSDDAEAYLGWGKGRLSEDKLLVSTNSAGGPWMDPCEVSTPGSENTASAHTPYL